MKKCSCCSIIKPLIEFPSSGYYTRSDGTKGKSYKPECKPCLVQKQKEQYNALWNKYFVAECSRCGYNKSRAALELHHTTLDKEFSFAQRYSISEEKFAAEAAKCVVLCANCHREVHEELRGGVS
jgi:hypothetical protein